MEKQLFPSLAEGGTDALAFQDLELAELALRHPGRLGLIQFVALVDESMVGFAIARTFTLPGEGQLDPDGNVLLDRIGVDPRHRLAGVGGELLAAVVTAARRSHGQFIVAHIPADAATFYKSAGWNVGDRNHGFAWLPSGSFLHADLPDLALGFPYMAWRQLQNFSGVSFEFPRRAGIPTLDAAHALKPRVDSGEIRLGVADVVAKQALELLERFGSPPAKGAFGQRI